MKLIPFTFNGGTIHDGVNYKAHLQTEGQLSPNVDIIEVKRTNNFPQYAGKEFNSKLLPITIDIPSGAGTLVDSLNEILDTTDLTERVFICKDELNSNKEWYVNAVVQRHADYGPHHAEYILYTADPVWRAVTGGSVGYSGTSSPGTVLGTVSGNRVAKPVITITPGAAKTGSYAYKHFIDISNPSNVAYTAYPVNVVDDGSGTAVWDSGTLVAGGTISSAAGNDVRVIMDGSEVGRWFGDFNSGTTKVWANVDLTPKTYMTLNAALGTATPSEIVFKKNSTNYTNLKKLPSSGILKTPANEFLSYSDIELNSYKVTGITRGLYGSTVGTVALGGTVTWLEHETWLVYGNASAEAPIQDDNLEPIIDHSTSDNITHDWNLFGEIDGQRTLSWKPTILRTRGKESYTYGGNQGTVDTDPFTDIGMAAIGYVYGSRWQAEDCNLLWNLYHPAGGTQAVYSGEMYKSTTTYPTYKRLYKSTNGISGYWRVAAYLTTPTTAGSWEAFAGTVALTSNYKHFMFNLAGGMSALASASSYLEVGDFTMNLATANVPSVSIGTAQPNYNLDMVIENTTTGEAINLNYVMEVGHTLTIDCVNKTVEYDNNLSALSALSIDTNRNDWMTLNPGANTITITEDGMTDMDITITWEEVSL